MSATILTDWCSRAGLDHDEAFLVTGIPDTVDDVAVNGVLETVQSKIIITEGKTLDELVSEMGAATPKTFNVISAPSSEALLQAVGKVLDRVMKPISENSPYQRLRTFSGKRKRITGSLRGPALDAINSLCVRSSEATVTNYLDVLESAYGTTESADDLYYKFRNSLQQDGEMFSEYLHRIEKLLYRVVLRGIIEAGPADKKRLEQIDRGALLDDLTVIRLRIRDRQEDPPTFEQLTAPTHFIRANTRYVPGRYLECAAPHL
ncbi:hypothetical protein FKM82_010019 [Ascaphus truei]